MIETAGLTRQFGSLVAVDRLDLTIAPGELFGLVGPDGAGKTTTLRMLVGVLTPSAGRATIAGHDLAVGIEAIRRKVGYLSQRFSLYGDLTVAENLALIAALFGVDRRSASQRAERLLALTELTDASHRRADLLSGGMRQKLALACALIHAPPLLVLDEPTNGVDPLARREFWRLLTGLLADGTTILITTAYLDEAELCGRIGFMAGGRLLRLGTPAELRAAVRTTLVELRARPRPAALAVARTVAGVVDVRAFGERLHVAFSHSLPVEPAMATLTASLTAAAIQIDGLRPIAPTLEDAVIQLTEATTASGQL